MEESKMENEELPAENGGNVSAKEPKKRKKTGGRKKSTLSIDERLRLSAEALKNEEPKYKPYKQRREEHQKRIECQNLHKSDFLTMVRNFAMRERYMQRMKKYPLEQIYRDNIATVWKVPPEIFAKPDTYNTSELTEIATIHLFDDPYIPYVIKFNLDVEVKKSKKKPDIIKPFEPM